MNNKNFKYAIIILVAMCVIRNLSSTALISTTGLFLDPVSKSLNISVGELTLISSVTSITTLIVYPFAGKLASKYSLKIMMLVACLSESIGFMLLSRMDTILGRCLCGMMMALGTVVLINLSGPLLINRWFKTNTARYIGILTAFYGIFGAIVQPVIISLIAKIGWRQTYFSVGLTAGIIIFGCILFFIKDYPEKDETIIAIDDTELKDPKQQVLSGATVKEALSSPSFYGLFIFLVMFASIGVFTQFMDPFGLSLGYSSSDVSYLVTVTMLGTSIGALTTGILANRIGLLKSSLLLSVIAIFATICLSFAKLHIIVFYLGAASIGICYMSLLVLAPLLAAKFFGHRQYSQIFADLMMGQSVAYMVFMPFYGLIFNATKSYALAIVLIFVLAIIGTFAFFVGWKTRKEY